MTDHPDNMPSLTAAAKRLTSNTKRKGGRKTGSSERSWQDDAWDMYDLVGEQHFLATMLAGQISKAVLYVGRKDRDEAPERIEDDPQIDALMHEFGGASGQTELLYRLAVNLFIAGEGWLVEIPGDDETETVWRMLSVSEVSHNSARKTIEITDEDGDKIEYGENEVTLIRVWRPHPRSYSEADSPTRASLPVLKELVGLTMHVSAQIDSRLAGAGVLTVSQGMQRALRIAAGVPEDSEADIFTEALIEAMMTPIEDRASASAIVPLVVTKPDDVEAPTFLSFSSALDQAAQGMREEAIRRLALGQDAPPELLLGTGSMNHWGGWLVQEETVSSHVEPPLALICNALTEQFLQPALEELGYDDADKIVVWYEVDHLIARPNRTAEATDAYDRGVISKDALRRLAGFDDTDASTDEVTAEGIVLGMVKDNPGLITNPGVPALVETIQSLLSNQADDLDPVVDEEGEIAPVPETAGERPAGPTATDVPGPGSP